METRDVAIVVWAVTMVSTLASAGAQAAQNTPREALRPDYEMGMTIAKRMTGSKSLFRLAQELAGEGEALLPGLVALVEKGDRPVSEEFRIQQWQYAAFVLGQIGDHRCTPWLAARLGHADASSYYFVKPLGQLRVREAVPYLVRWLQEDRRWEVYSAAWGADANYMALALEQITGRDFSPGVEPRGHVTRYVHKKREVLAAVEDWWRREGCREYGEAGKPFSLGIKAKHGILPAGRRTLGRVFSLRDTIEQGYASIAVCEAVTAPEAVSSAYGACQEFEVKEVLAGARPARRTIKVNYEYFSHATPPERRIAKGERVIWILRRWADPYRGVRTLADTSANGEMIRTLIADTKPDGPPALRNTESRAREIVKIEIKVWPPEGMAHCQWAPDGAVKGGHTSGGGAGGGVRVYEDTTKISPEKVTQIWQAVAAVPRTAFAPDAVMRRDPSKPAVHVLLHFRDGSAARLTWPFKGRHADPKVQALAKLLYENTTGGW